jgi:pimeloyl-ACP methyl ester carboxylesterase
MTRLLACTALATILFTAPATAQDKVSHFSEYVARGGKGPVVLVISGASGPANYGGMGSDLAAAGFHVVMLDGNEFHRKPMEAAVAMLRDAADRGRASPGAEPGKVGVVGFSRGGGPTLSAAATRPDFVFAAVAQYPDTTFSQHPAATVEAIRVPTLLLAGALDSFDCCRIEAVRHLAAAVQAAPGARFLEVVEYPDAGHAWNLNRTWNGAAASDSFKRTVAHLQRHRDR